MKKINNYQYSRPALKIFCLLGTLIILAGMVTLSVFAAPSVVSEVDLSVEGYEATVNGALIKAQTIEKMSSGTGVMDPFLQIKSDTGNVTPTYGYNYDTAFYDGSPGHDIPSDATYVTAGWTHAVNLNTLPQAYIGSTMYRQILLDVNETGSDRPVSLDELQIFKHSDSEQIMYVPTPPEIGAATLVWDLQAGPSDPIAPAPRYLLVADIGAGSGKTDVNFLIPDLFNEPLCDFGSMSCDTWVYVYAHFGTNHNQEDGFEEFSVGIQGPLAVTLVSSAAEATIPGEIKVDWTTASEVNTAGFNLYRSTGQSGEKQFLDVIPSESPGSIGMGAYQYVDTDVQASVTYTYWLEEQTLDGTEGYVQQLQATGLWGYVFIPMITR